MRIVSIYLFLDDSSLLLFRRLGGPGVDGGDGDTTPRSKSFRFNSSSPSASSIHSLANENNTMLFVY
jgi:hypothetical protein